MRQNPCKKKIIILLETFLESRRVSTSTGGAIALPTNRPQKNTTNKKSRNGSDAIFARNVLTVDALHGLQSFTDLIRRFKLKQINLKKLESGLKSEVLVFLFWSSNREDEIFYQKENQTHL